MTVAEKQVSLSLSSVSDSADVSENVTDYLSVCLIYVETVQFILTVALSEISSRTGMRTKEAASTECRKSIANIMDIS